MSASVHEISNLIDPVAVAAHSEASQLGHKVSRAASRRGGGTGPTLTRSAPQVSQMASYFEPLVMAAIGTVSKILSSQQQMAVLDQTKTLTESALQMLYTAKEAGGNPKVLLQKLAQLAQLTPAASSTCVAPVCVLGAGGPHAGGPGGVGADDEGGRGRPGRHASRGR